MGPETHRLRNMEGGWTGDCPQDKFTVEGFERDRREREKKKRSLLQQNHLIAKDPSNHKCRVVVAFSVSGDLFFLP